MKLCEGSPTRLNPKGGDKELTTSVTKASSVELAGVLVYHSLRKSDLGQKRTQDPPSPPPYGASSPLLTRRCHQNRLPKNCDMPQAALCSPLL